MAPKSSYRLLLMVLVSLEDLYKEYNAVATCRQDQDIGFLLVSFT